jgi:hypothetical protein
MKRAVVRSTEIVQLHADYISLGGKTIVKNHEKNICKVCKRGLEMSKEKSTVQQENRQKTWADSRKEIEVNFLFKICVSISFTSVVPYL